MKKVLSNALKTNALENTCVTLWFNEVRPIKFMLHKSTTNEQPRSAYIRFVSQIFKEKAKRPNPIKVV